MRKSQKLFCDSVNYDKIRDNAKATFEDTETEFLLMPCLINVHWILVVMDNKRNKFYYFNSFYPTGNTKSAKVLIAQFVNATSRKTKPKSVFPRVQHQIDSVSCGLFTIHNTLSFVECMESDNTEIMIPPIDVLKYRKKIKTEILDASDDITKFCPKCNEPSTSNISCIFCQKSVHDECANKSLGTIRSKDNELICFECSNYLLNLQ